MVSIVFENISKFIFATIVSFIRNNSFKPTITRIKKITQNINFSSVSSLQPIVATLSITFSTRLLPRLVEKTITFYYTSFWRCDYIKVNLRSHDTLLYQRQITLSCYCITLSLYCYTCTKLSCYHNKVHEIVLL